jgi:hypothetical protein
MDDFTNKEAARALPFSELVRRTARHGALCPCAMCSEIRRR